MIKWKFRKTNKELIECSMDVLKRIEYLTRDKIQFPNPVSFELMTKSEYLDYVKETLEIVHD